MGTRIMPDAPQPPEPLLRGVFDVAERMDFSAARATAVCPAPCSRPAREGGKGTGTGERLVGAHVRQALGPQRKPARRASAFYYGAAGPFFTTSPALSHGSRQMALAGPIPVPTERHGGCVPRLSPEKKQQRPPLIVHAPAAVIPQGQLAVRPQGGEVAGSYPESSLTHSCPLPCSTPTKGHHLPSRSFAFPPGWTHSLDRGIICP